MARGLEIETINLEADDWESCQQILLDTLDHNVTPLIKTDFEPSEISFEDLPPPNAEADFERDAEQILPHFDRSFSSCTSTSANDDDDTSSSMEVDTESDSYMSASCSFHQLSDDQIANMNFKELSRLMREANLSEQRITEVKALRRRLKNRHSARICSNKKREKCAELGETNRQLYNDLANLKDRNRALEHEVQQFRQKMEQLRDIIRRTGAIHSVDATTARRLGL